MSHSQILWDTDCAASSFQCQGYQWQCCLSVVQLLKPLVRLLNSKSLSSSVILPAITVRNQRKETTQRLPADLVQGHLPPSRTNWGLISKRRWKNPMQTFLGQKKKVHILLHFFPHNPHVTTTWVPCDPCGSNVTPTWPHMTSTRDSQFAFYLKFFLFVLIIYLFQGAKILFWVSH